MGYRDRFVAHDGSEGLSPDGWLPDRISVGVLTRAFPPELVDEVIEVTGTRERRRRLLPARLMVYFVLALWLFRGRNCGYGQVMAKLTDGLYCQRRGAGLLAGRLAPGGRVDAGGGRQWRLLNISSLSRGRGKLGAGPVRMLFEHVAGPTGADGAPGVFCCGLRVVSMDGSVTDVPDSDKNAAFFGRPSSQSRDGAFPQARWVAAAESGTGSLLGAAIGRYTGAEQPLAADLLGCFGPGMLVLADRKFLSWAAARACAPATPGASCRRCGRCSPSTRPSAGSPGSPRTRRASPRTRSASRTPWPPRPPLWRLSPPEQAGLAFATFLAKILMPAFFTHDRPGRASPRKTKKAGDFPARKPGEPSVTKVTRTIEFHLLCPWQLT
jgi:hypothetical protein